MIVSTLQDKTIVDLESHPEIWYWPVCLIFPTSIYLYFTIFADWRQIVFMCNIFFYYKHQDVLLVQKYGRCIPGLSYLSSFIPFSHVVVNRTNFIFSYSGIHLCHSGRMFCLPVLIFFRPY